jgi:drug/metabolite transporter (DMT)-like permease
MNIAIVYILISVCGSAVGQILPKKGMVDLGPLTLTLNNFAALVWRVATNPYVFLGLAIYGFGTIFWLTALSRVDLSYAYPFASLSYIVMLVASWGLFDEHISPLRLVGTLIVGLGVLVISRS